jgi:hypothetical protein
MLNLKYSVIVLTFIAIECSEINFNESEFCDFFETKNITSGEKFVNGTILFDGFLYPEEYYRTYNYTLQENDKIQTSPHIRGCFCKLVICVRICPGSVNYTVVSRDNHSVEISLDSFGIIKSWPIFDNSTEFMMKVEEDVPWNISKVFILRHLIIYLI